MTEENKNIIPDDISSEESLQEKEELKKEYLSKNSDDIEIVEKSELNKTINYDKELDKINTFEINNLLDYFSDFVEHINVDDTFNESSKFVEEIKTIFFKKYHVFIANKRKKFAAEGGNPDDFKLKNNYDREKFEDSYKKFKDLKNIYNEKLQAELNKNLKRKKEIIEIIKNLVHTEESINSTFNTFKAIEKEWHSLGPVPPQNNSELWGSYNFAIEQFYDFIKINKELRDLDQKKNYDKKIQLCETAENLPYEEQSVDSFKQLQSLHEKWKTIGPVAREEREKIWERFSEITKQINKVYQEHFIQQKKQEEENLKLKTTLCEKAEAIANGYYERLGVWNKKQNELAELNAQWRTIGHVSRKFNQSIYIRFRDAFDNFFEKKKIFYEKNKEHEEKNLEAKLKICESAEQLKDSSDFQNTTSKIIGLQEKWKKIGSVPRNKSDETWKRFRNACNEFFENKAAHYKQLKNLEGDNLKAKEALLIEMENFKPLKSDNENLDAVKIFQKRWKEIGFVSKNNANRINTSYQKILNKLFEIANIDETRQQILSYTEFIKNKQNTNDFNKFLQNEQYNIRKNIQTLEKEIFKIENSLSRFSVSKGSEGFLKTYENELEKKKSIKELLTQKHQILKQFLD